MRTKPLLLTGHTLAINCAPSAAHSMGIEIQDAAGTPIDGYTLTDTPEIVGDEIAHSVAWKGGVELGKVAGQPARLRLVMQDADLYRIRFED